MTLRLFESTATDFASLGLGSLTEAEGAEVYREVNGQYRLSFRYPVTGKRFRELLAGRLVTAKPDPEHGAQPFRVHTVTRPMRGMVTVTADHWVFDLKKVICARAQFATDPAQALSGIAESALGPCPFVFETDIAADGGGYFSHYLPTDVWTLLGDGEGCFRAAFGGELEADGTAVRLLRRLGSDRGFAIRYGKNLRDLQQEERIDQTYNGIVPYWTGLLGGIPYAVTLPEGYVEKPGRTGPLRLVPVDFTQDIGQAEPDEDTLRAWAMLYVARDDFGVPEVSWRVDFVQLEQTEEYKDRPRRSLALGDTVRVIFEELGVNASSRVSATRYDPILERYIDITLGALRPNAARTVAESSRRTDILSRCVESADGVTTIRGADVRIARLNGQRLAWAEGEDGRRYLCAADE